MYQMKFFGLGGQGVVTAAKTLSVAVSIYEDRYAVTIPSYGHERRGAPVFTDMVVDDKPILTNCFVYNPDVVVVMDDQIKEKGVDVSGGVGENTILLINTASRERAAEYAKLYAFSRTFYVGATQIAIEKAGTNIPNAAMLGLVAKAGLVSISSVEKAILDFFDEKRGSKNADAARAAYEAAQTL